MFSNTKFYANLAVKSILQNKAQYRSLFAVCLFGVAIILASVLITDGMVQAVQQRAKLYYGGDLQFMGGSKGFDIKDPDAFLDKIKPLVAKDVKFYTRFDYDARNSAFYYEGQTIRQRVFKGVDFEAEKDLFSSFTFVEGGASVSSDHNTMILSEPIARRLGIHAQDMITLQLYTIGNYTNTINLLVTGIFQDASLFGMYTSYIDIQSLRSAAGYPEGYTNRICLNYGKRSPSSKEVLQIQSGLEKEFNMFPLTDDKQKFYGVLFDDVTPKPIYALITLDANIKDLQMVIKALSFVTLLITVILVTIIAVGIGSTYRVIVMKRITEIGIYRAIGMNGTGVKKVFLFETFFLLFAGFVSGIVLAAIISLVVSYLNLSVIPAFDIFLTAGRLIPSLNPLKWVVLLGVIAVTTILSVLFTIRNVVHISPVNAFATTA